MSGPHPTAPPQPWVGLRPARPAVLGEIERFLYWEALLLDERRYEEWLDLFTGDLRYWMPVRTDRPTAVHDGPAPGQLGFFDETKDSLTRRVAKLRTGMAWAEEPPSRTRHVVSNVLADVSDSPSEARVSSNFVVYRTRLETKQDLFVGRRDDLLRRVAGSWKIARRTILLDQTVLSADNLSIFF